jgi:hypothetical protein
VAELKRKMLTCLNLDPVERFALRKLKRSTVKKFKGKKELNCHCEPAGRSNPSILDRLLRRSNDLLAMTGIDYD